MFSSSHLYMYINIVEYIENIIYLQLIVFKKILMSIHTLLTGFAKTNLLQIRVRLITQLSLYLPLQLGNFIL